MREINAEELIQLQQNDKNILLDVFATWCQPCKILIPKLESIANEYGNVEFVKMDANKNMSYLQEYEITSVPTVLIFNGKTLVKRLIGLQPDGTYKDVLNTLI